jgi:hypothetical protein
LLSRKKPDCVTHVPGMNCHPSLRKGSRPRRRAANPDTQASTIGEIDAAFATLARERLDALFVAGDAFFVSRAVQFATLTARDRIPATYSLRDYVAAGLMSYGTDFPGRVSSSRRLYRQHPKGREACRPARDG